MRQGLFFPALVGGRAQSLEILAYGRNLNVLLVQSRALNDFHGIFGNLLSHIDSKGDTDQIGVLELHSRPFVAIIEQNIVAGGLKLLRNRSPKQTRIASSFEFVDTTTTSKGAIEGGSQNPFSSLLCSIGRGENALDANSITAHDRRNFLAVAVEDARAHRFRIFVTEFEDVPDLDRRIDAQRQSRNSDNLRPRSRCASRRRPSG